MIGWVGFSTLLGFFMYYNDDPYGKPTKVKHSIYIILVGIAFALIFGFVQINWLP